MKSEPNEILLVVIDYLEVFSWIAKTLIFFPLLFWMLALSSISDNLSFLKFIEEGCLAFIIIFGYIAMFFTRYVGAFIVFVLSIYTNVDLCHKSECFLCFRGECFFSGNARYGALLIDLPVYMYLLLYVLKVNLRKFVSRT